MGSGAGSGLGMVSGGGVGSVVSVSGGLGCVGFVAGVSGSGVAAGGAEVVSEGSVLGAGCGSGVAGFGLAG